MSNHDADIIPTVKTIRRWLNKISEEQFYRLIEVKLADIHSQAPGTQEHRINQYYKVKDILDEVIATERCFKIKDLKINGNDIISLGVKEGKFIGEILNYLLDKVVSEEISNEHQTLIKTAQEKINGRILEGN